MYSTLSSRMDGISAMRSDPRHPPPGQRIHADMLLALHVLITISALSQTVLVSHCRV